MADAGTTPDVPVVMDGDVIVEFNEASSRQQINSGESVKTLFGKIRKFLTDLKAVAFSGSYDDLSNTPDLTQYATKAELDTKAEKALYGDTTINVGRKAGTTVGSRSTAEGSNTTASGICSHAESGETTASGDFSHAEGLKTTAAQSYTHTEGYNTSSNAPAAHAEGYSSIAAGQASHAEGQGTQAVGNNSHSGGYGASSFNNSSFSHGIYTIANKDGEIAFGKYNESNDDTVFSVGDGTSDSARHNAFEITKTGGKLHDKDIAVKDDIPTSLPASGGNADTVGDFPANFLLKNIATANNLTTSIDTCYDTGTYSVEAAYTPNFPVGYGNYGFLEIRAYGSIRYQTVRFETGVIINRAIIVGQGSWTSWAELFSPMSKPYVTGSATVAANSATCTSNHGFTPSAVIWWDGSLSGVAVSFSDTQFTIDKTSYVDRTINYLIFK